MEENKVHRFEADISGIEIPQRFTWPFDYVPHPLSVLAARQLQAYLEHTAACRQKIPEGKMFGVLVVRTAAGLGFLAAYSGHLGHRSEQAFFVPPVLDLQDPKGFFLPEERRISGLNARIGELQESEEYRQLRERLQEAAGRSEQILAEARQELRQAKARRDALRRTLPPEQQAALIRESQYQKAEYRRLLKRLNQELQEYRGRLESFENGIRALKEERKRRSEALQEKVFKAFVMHSARGEQLSILEIFDREDHKVPPAGTGECAAPKLLEYAYRHGLEPVCMAEFWWGRSPVDIVRRHGSYYPACSGKCGPLLRFMLQGLQVDPDPVGEPVPAGPETGPEKHWGIRELYADDFLIAVSKPAGLLSVPGKTGALSLADAVRRLYPEISGPGLVHRLDMDTSGIVLVAKDLETYRRLQKQFMNGEVVKRYTALLDGEMDSTVRPFCGTIDLPLAPDLDNRPSQMVSREYGKPALTRYRVLEVRNGRTLVEMQPLTGRTHQLRVHAAHPSGLDRPISGDPLYGTRGQRLWLHAASLEFTHPYSGKRILIEDPSGFTCTAPEENGEKGKTDAQADRKMENKKIN